VKNSNNIICPNCNHEFSLNDLQEKIVQEEASKMAEEQVKQAKEQMKKEEKLRVTEEVKKATDSLSKEVEKGQNNKKELERKLQKTKDTRESDYKRIQAEAEKKYEKDKRMLELKHEVQRKQDNRKLKAAQKLSQEVQNGHMSSQVSGEIGEDYVLEELSKAYPSDSFIEILKGEEGADWIQQVKSIDGTVIGEIYIESKNTKIFRRSWIPKLQKDMEDRKITAGIIVSRNFLTDQQGLNAYSDQGIHIFKMDPNVFVMPIGLIREKLKAVYSKAQVGEIQKSDIPKKVFEFLNSEKFKNQIQQILGALKSHLGKIDEREKYNAKIIKQDRKLIQEVGQGILKTMKDDINEISSEETIKLPEFKVEEFKVEKD